MNEYEKAVARLKAGEELNEDDLKTLVWFGQVVDIIEGEEHRWTRGIVTSYGARTSRDSTRLCDGYLMLSLKLKS